MTIVSEGVYKVCCVCNFVIFFAVFIVNSFNFSFNVICFGSDWKCWLEILKDIFSDEFSIETSIDFTSW